MELVPWGRTDRAVYLAPSEAATFRGLWGDAAQALLRLTRRCVARGLPPPPADDLARAAQARAIVARVERRFEDEHNVWPF